MIKTRVESDVLVDPIEVGIDEDPAEFENNEVLSAENRYEAALRSLFNDSTMSKQSTPETVARYDQTDGGKWVSSVVSFHVRDCTLPLIFQANISAPGGTGAKLQKYKEGNVSVEERRNHRIGWNETYLSPEVIKSMLEGPFSEKEMNAVSEIAKCIAISQYCVGFEK